MCLSIAICAVQSLCSISLVDVHVSALNIIVDSPPSVIQVCFHHQVFLEPKNGDIEGGNPDPISIDSVQNNE